MPPLDVPVVNSCHIDFSGGKLISEMTKKKRMNQVNKPYEAFLCNADLKVSYTIGNMRSSHKHQVFGNNLNKRKVLISIYHPNKNSVKRIKSPPEDVLGKVASS